MPLRPQPQRDDDSQQPSTSSGPQLRIEANRKKFERIKNDNDIPTIWSICNIKQKQRKLTKQSYDYTRSLQGINIAQMLDPHKSYLSDLCKSCGSTYEDLCGKLRFFVSFKRQPMFKTENAAKLFKMVACCIQCRGFEWVAVITKKTLYDTITANCMEAARLGKEFEVPTEEQPEPIKNLLEPSTSSSVPAPPLTSHVFRPDLEDEHMKDNHCMNEVGANDLKWNETLHELLKTHQRRNAKVGKRNRPIGDVEFFADDKLLHPTQISFRLQNFLQIVDFQLARTEEDGYFYPATENFNWYLYEKYNEAHAECLIDFKDFKLPERRKMGTTFRKGSFTPAELGRFHFDGRHIHGFFEVWEELKGRGHRLSNGKWVSRRYIVDIYNGMKFPLYVDFDLWPVSLKWAFDKLSVYSLKLMIFVKKFGKELRSLGESLFAEYPSYIQIGMRTNVLTQKQRHQYHQTLHSENSRMFEKVLNPSLFPKIAPIDHEFAKYTKKRRARKSDDPNATAGTRAPKTPRKALDSRFGVISSASPSAPSISVVRTLTVQKENMERINVPPLVSSSSSSANVNLNVPPHRRRQSLETRQRPNPPNQQAATIKRRHEEMAETSTSSGVFVPPMKKAPLDSWDDHVHHNEMDEEHIDEEGSEGGDDLDDDGGRQENRQIGFVSPELVGPVWVPQDRGFEVAPEQYAREILEHYGVKKTGEENDKGSESSESSSSGNLPVQVGLPAQASKSAPSVLPAGPLADLVADMPSSSSSSSTAPTAIPRAPQPKQRRSRKSNPKPTEPASTIPISTPTQPERLRTMSFGSTSALSRPELDLTTLTASRAPSGAPGAFTASAASGASGASQTATNGAPRIPNPNQNASIPMNSANPANPPPQPPPKRIYSLKQAPIPTKHVYPVKKLTSSGPVINGVTLAQSGVASSPAKNPYVGVGGHGIMAKKNGAIAIPGHPPQIPLSKEVLGAMNPHLNGGSPKGRSHPAYYGRQKPYPYHMDPYTLNAFQPPAATANSPSSSSSSSILLNPVASPVTNQNRLNPIIRPVLTRTPTILQKPSSTASTTPPGAPGAPAPPAPPAEQRPGQRQSPAHPSTLRQDSSDGRMATPPQQSSPGRQIEREAPSPTTPASRAMERILQNSQSKNTPPSETTSPVDFGLNSSRCRRGMSFNDQMDVSAYKEKRWDPVLPREKSPEDSESLTSPDPPVAPAVVSLVVPTPAAPIAPNENAENPQPTPSDAPVKQNPEEIHGGESKPPSPVASASPPIQESASMPTTSSTPVEAVPMGMAIPTPSNPPMASEAPIQNPIMRQPSTLGALIAEAARENSGNSSASGRTSPSETTRT